jgi:hypothetical protein
MTTTTIMSSTRGMASTTGTAHQANAWYGFTDGLHTLAIHTDNLVGRVYIEGSLADQPSDADWFPLELTPTSYVEYPQVPMNPTGTNLRGDTGVLAFSFRANLMWIRARLDRSYLNDKQYFPDEIDALGSVEKIILSR